MHAAIPAVLIALGIAGSSAALGVAVARMLWADDLRHAQNIKAITDETEKHLRAQIGHLEGHVKILEQRLGANK